MNMPFLFGLLVLIEKELFANFTQNDICKQNTWDSAKRIKNLLLVVMKNILKLQNMFHYEMLKWNITAHQKNLCIWFSTTVVGGRHDLLK